MNKPYINSIYSINKELELMDKLSLCSEQNSRLLNLSQTISHNLNAYTSNLKMLLDLIESEDNPIENKLALGHLRTVSNDLHETISNLSQIVYVQNNSDVIKQSLSLNLYLDKIMKTINGYNTEDKALFVNNIPENSFVTFNPAYLESILLNFTTNAIKYAHPDRFPVIEFDFFLENSKKILTIKDNGLGLDLKKYGDSLFGLYKTFHNNKDANGFGLYITKYQIEAMKGNVSVDSKVGEGTKFKIVFFE